MTCQFQKFVKLEISWDTEVCGFWNKKTLKASLNNSKLLFKTGYQPRLVACFAFWCPVTLHDWRLETRQIRNRAGLSDVPFCRGAVWYLVGTCKISGGLSYGWHCCGNSEDVPKQGMLTKRIRILL